MRGLAILAGVVAVACVSVLAALVVVLVFAPVEGWRLGGRA